MKPVTIYTTNYCPYCTAAKKFLEANKVPYEDVHLEKNEDLRNKLSQENGGWRTVPMIFVGEEFIGGYTDMMAIHARGELLPKVNS